MDILNRLLTFLRERSRSGEPGRRFHLTGQICLVIGISWFALLMPSEAVDGGTPRWVYWAYALLIGGAASYALGLYLRPVVLSRARYMRFRREIGFALFLTGLGIATSMAGLARVDRLDEVFILPDDGRDRIAWPTVRDSIVRTQTTLEDQPEFVDVVASLDDVMGQATTLQPQLMRVVEPGNKSALQGTIDGLRQEAFALDVEFRSVALAGGEGLRPAEVLAVQDSLALFATWTRELKVPRVPNQAAVLLYAIFFALFGTLFYLYRALDRKQSASDAFNRDLFWGGLWFRAGQSLLYTLLLFLVLRSNLTPDLTSGEGPGLSEALLPLYALLIGMYVRLAEGVFEGFGRRMFNMLGMGDKDGSADEGASPDREAALEQVKEHHGGWVGETKMRITELAFEEKKRKLSVTLSAHKDAEPLREPVLIQALTVHVASVPDLKLPVELICLAAREKLGAKLTP